MCNAHCTWTALATRVINIYNDTPHSVTWYAPRFLLIGEKRENEVFQNEEEESETLEEARLRAIEKSERSHARNAFYFNKNRKDVTLEVGQWVYCKLASKLNRGAYNPIRSGPHQITRVISNTMFEIDKDGKKVVTNKKNLRLKLNRLEID